MAPKVIIDTDPVGPEGVDDVHALLLALAANPDELEIELISVTWGNVEVKNCLRNVVSLFHVIQNEIEFRKKKDISTGFKILEKSKIRVAVGADGPLDGTGSRSADYFHGRDGLQGLYNKHPHLTPQDPWEDLFKMPPAESVVTTEAKLATESEISVGSLFSPCPRPAHHEMLSILAKNPPDTIDIIAIGPLTTVALAAATDPITFLRVKTLVYMGGAVERSGNMTPLAEFNIYADAVAAARVFALTSPVPASTMPPNQDALTKYPSLEELGARRLNLVLFPLDITEQHALPRAQYLDYTKPHVDAGSPLALFGSYIFEATFQKLEALNKSITGLAIHDPMCVWFVIDALRNPAQWSVGEPDDIRIETTGQWTRGACVVDRRGRKDMAESDVISETEVVGDSGGWLSRKRGNRVRVCKKTPGIDTFASFLLQSVYGKI